MKVIYMILTTIMLLFCTNTTAYAETVLETPVTYGPSFFADNPEISTEDVILSEDGSTVIAIKDKEENTTVQAMSLGQNKWNITLTEEEKIMIAQIVNLEAGNQCDLGQQAIVEVILNRVTSPNFSNSVIGVLSQKGQFSTWKHRAKATPTAREYANIEAVLSGHTNIFPSKTVFFSRRAQNKRVQQVIQDHVFCNER